jgi:signal transduction histidine kinase
LVLERRRRATLLLVASAIVVVAVLVVFAIELSNSQANSKAAVETRVHERAVLAGSLVNSLFETIPLQVPAEAKTFGGATVSSALLLKEAGINAYVALLRPDGSVIASTPGFTSTARAQLRQSGVMRLIAAGHPYALGNMVGHGKAVVIDSAVALPTAYGRRILVEGAAPSEIVAFLGGTLKDVPGTAGSHNLIVDASDTVIASNLASRPPGYRITGAARAALGHSSGDRNGRFYDQVPLANSTWRIVLSSPDSALFASVSGWNEALPWLVLVAFGLMAAAALGLGWRVLHSAERNLAEANATLESVNAELETSNAELQRHAAELARSNAELDQFASIASHDLQEPLRKVRTFTEQLASTESDRLSERGADYLTRANRAAERMQGLIQDLLQFSRVTTNPQPFATVDLAQVVSEVLEDLSLELESAGTVLSVGELPSLHADPLQMRQLVLNLISNAVKFRREGVPSQVSIDGEVIDGVVKLTVTDNGIGFEPQYSTRIFRVFERLNGRTEYPGTGIGLALCQKIVARHHGQIVAEGRLDHGATFTVELPVEQSLDDLAPVSGDRTDPIAKEVGV